MAHPKRRHSNMRTRLRRTHDSLDVRALNRCSNCNGTVQSHRICPHCGHYRGKQVITIRQKGKEAESAS